MKLSLKRLGKYVVLPLVCAAAGLVAGALIYREAAQRDIADRRAIASPDGIDVLEPVTIGDTQQWLSIRGRDRAAPVLLYVHGGPGAPMMPFAHAFQDPLEDNFVVVQWDQRGAGKSRGGFDALEGITIDRMVDDVIEVTQHLRERFDRDTIVLLGHSWGSILGVKAVKRQPELYSAYIGVGQVVNMQENETITYRYTLEEAKRRGDAEGLRALESLAPYPDPDAEAFIQKVNEQRSWLMKYDGSMLFPGGLRTLAAQLFVAPEYTIGDVVSFFPAALDSGQHFWDELMQIDLKTLGTDFDVPIFIISGTQDYQVPFEIAEPWYQSIRAPHKEFLWVPEAAHMPMCAQPELFARLLERRVLPVVAENSM